MKTLIQTIVSVLILTNLTSCKKDDDTPLTTCEDKVIISASEYLNAPDHHLTINNIEIKGDCLVIDFGSSGCDGSTWVLKLIDSDVMIETYPPIRNLRLSLKNEEVCDAYFTKEVSYDISKLQVDGDKVILNIKGFDGLVWYEY
ncbi:hypothetical protein [Carboxylicivirga sp. N1Y90]|uniref:hypothetical protein n=1 Tax=Carboxylicivirga fragile TaxID=3417571 RepID=UPI003D3268E6|nr:hypothetical protein [Marinilabiliaceae bacterium N1Y90]